MSDKKSLEDLDRDLKKLEQRIESASFAEVLRKDVLPLAIAAVAANFERATSPDGASWPARKVAGDGHPLLDELGALKAAATGTGPGYVERVTDRELVLGVDKSVDLGGIPGAGVHNFGFRNIPQREFLGAADDHLEKLDQAIADGVEAILFKDL